MAEENQVTKEPQGKAAQPPSGAQPAQQIMKEPQLATTKTQRKWKLVRGWLKAIVRREK